MDDLVKEREDRFVKCIICFGADAETQERLKDRQPRTGCGMCRGTGGVEVKFKRGLDSNEVVTTGKIGKEGFPIIYVGEEYDK